MGDSHHHIGYSELKNLPGNHKGNTSKAIENGHSTPFAGVHTPQADGQITARNKEQLHEKTLTAGRGDHYRTRTPAELIAAFPDGAATTAMVGDLWLALAGDVKIGPMETGDSTTPGLREIPTRIPDVRHKAAAGTGPGIPAKEIHEDAHGFTYQSVRCCDLSLIRNK